MATFSPWTIMSTTQTSGYRTCRTSSRPMTTRTLLRRLITQPPKLPGILSEVLTVRTSESIPGNLGGWVISRRCSVRVVIGLLEVLQVRYPEVWVVDIIVQGEKVAIYSRWEDVFAE